MPKSYEAPMFGTPTSQLLGWLTEAVSEAESWLKAQPDSADWPELMKLLSAPDPGDESSSLSNTTYNKAKRIYKEHVAALNSFRHEGEFKPTANPDLYEAAHTLTKLDRHWQKTSFAYERHREILQYAVGLGTCYAWETYRRDALGPGRGDVTLQALSPADVTFLQLPRSNDIQLAYGVLIREELPINLAKQQYPNLAFTLVPDRDEPGWMQKGLQKVQSLFQSPALRVAGTHPGDASSRPFPTVDIFHLYLRDASTNLSGQPRLMGKEGTNWSYVVPYEGQLIPTGFRAQDGVPLTREATPTDAMLFPLRREIIFSRTGIDYDGPSPWWHGRVPLARFRFGDNPWSALGQSMIGDIRTMQAGVEALMRDVEDASHVRLNMPMLFDEQLVSKGFADAFNPRLAGVRAGANLQMGDPVKFPIPAEAYNVPAYILEFMKQQEDRMDYLAAARDLVALAKAKQIPAADTMEKLLESAGPIVKDLIQSLAQPLSDLAEMRKAYYLQFYSVPRIIQTTDADGDEIDFLYRPDLIVPSVEFESALANAQRTKHYLSEFTFHISSQAMNEIHRMSTKLFFLQLMKIGFPIDWWTFADIAEIPNFGAEPLGTKNVMERWMAQKHILAEMQGAAAKHLPQQGDGRPNTNAKPPHVAQKEGGARSTIATS